MCLGEKGGGDVELGDYSHETRTRTENMDTGLTHVVYAYTSSDTAQDRMMG